MALEPIKTSILASSQSDKSGGLPKLNQTTLQDYLNGVSKEDEKRSDEKKDNERDGIALSQEARVILSQYNTQEDLQARITNNNLENKALQFRGLAQIASRRELNDSEKALVTDIRKSFADSGIDNDKAILNIAQRKLNEIQEATPALVNLLNTQNITGDQFKQLNSINKLLNNSNGFGSDQVEGALQLKADQLSKQLDDILAENDNRKLTNEVLTNLETIERQISSIQGYQVNVRDTIGRDGVII